MKAYQDQWLKLLNENSDVNFIIEAVCEQIELDDTGHTDPLTQKLAVMLIRALHGAYE